MRPLGPFPGRSESAPVALKRAGGKCPEQGLYLQKMVRAQVRQSAVQVNRAPPFTGASETLLKARERATTSDVASPEPFSFATCNSWGERGRASLGRANTISD